MTREHGSRDQEIVSGDQHLIDVMNGQARLSRRVLELLDKASEHPILSSAATAAVCAGAGLIVETVRPRKK